MGLMAALNDIPRPFWMVAMVVGFIWYWPIGLAVLAYLIGSGRLGCRSGPGRWHNMPPGGNGAAPSWGAGCWSAWTRHCQRKTEPAPSGNAAFDEYRAETLRRLEAEQQEFLAYLERLRQARDKAEFDRFMAEQQRNGTPPQEPT